MRHYRLPRHTVLGATLALLLPLHAATISEDFSTDPLGDTKGWQVFGETNLFTWDASTHSLQVTWDSRKPNSYFCHPLGTIVSRDDEFSVAFDLTLENMTAGIDPAKTQGFEIAIGLLQFASATQPQFQRGGVAYSPNLVELDYFPDATGIYGDALVSTVISTNTVFSTQGYAPGTLTLNDLFHVVMTHHAGEDHLTTLITRNGAAFTTLTANFTNDFRVDQVAVMSYSDGGQDPSWAGSVLAQGVVDNFNVEVPDPLRLQLALHRDNNHWAVSFDSRRGWSYQLVSSSDLKSWSPVGDPVPGIGGSQVILDQRPDSPNSCYSVVATKP